MSQMCQSHDYPGKPAEPVELVPGALVPGQLDELVSGYPIAPVLDLPKVLSHLSLLAPCGLRGSK